MRSQVILAAIVCLLFSGTVCSQRHELVMATTFSPDATAYIISRWQHQPQSVVIRTLNRTSTSLEQLLDSAGTENIDLVLTSSPMLLQHLQQHQRLANYDGAPEQSQRLVPDSIRDTAVAIAVSGFGLLINRTNLEEKQLPLPTDWSDLTEARYQGALLMSSPSRSDTNHLIVESLLQQHGWQSGWETLLSAAGNLITISSRSFGVADKVKNGLGSVGPTIDSYANLLHDDPHLVFRYFPNTSVSPTYIAITRNSHYPVEARRFIQFLLSPQGQQVLADTNTGKYPVIPLSADNPLFAQQQKLLQQSPLNYRLIMQRQRMVQKLFDTAISFRLSQLKDAWKALHGAENRLNRPLPEIRALLTAIPVTQAQSENLQYLNQFEVRSEAEQQTMEWQLFFQHQQRKAIKALEELK